ncbi:Very-long-chain enoyl-CoA reductase [Vermiconidia calcicola]|uniref:Very-long-chain enoyl-CoA reductase n=1 Tax=Vermiconidia calcicola TaxID=1690605 RepID=A0ACC3N7E5_9PEZI|nr:Very-long-chain enoyl-CoA reductase [Vermiconidia calcicola]
MASKPVNLKVHSRGKKIPKLPGETSIYLQGSASDLYQRIATQASFSTHRLRITKAEDGKPIPNDKSVSIASTGLKDGDAIQVKDLGPQIAWRTVFIIEYAGPLLIHPLFYFLRPYIYKNASAEPSTLQALSCLTITLHFLKRELETLFVHRFSNATMPALNIFKNSAHYWLLSGLLIAYFIYSPTSLTAGSGNLALTYTALALYAIGELGNLNAHLVLRSLRSPGGTERGVPKGLGFDLVTCPNYMFETVAWLGILMITRSWSTGVFVAVAVAQMAAWAKKKENRYRKELGGKYPKKRFAMIPGVW